MFKESLLGFHLCVPLGSKPESMIHVLYLMNIFLYLEREVSLIFQATDTTAAWACSLHWTALSKIQIARPYNFNDSVK